MSLTWLRAAALLCGLAAALPSFAAPVRADDAKPGGDPVVATINGREIHRSALMQAYAHSRLSQAPLESVYGQVLDFVITSQLLLNEARKANLVDDPEVKDAVRFATEGILEQTYIERKIAQAVTDDAIKARYEEDIKHAEGRDEIHARHILLASEDDAKKVIAEIKGGAKFEDVAKSKSKDPSAAQNGGDLGFFTKDQMVPEFAEAAFAMKPGEVSAAPVKTEFGWHVIEVLERRKAAPPSLEESKSAIVAQLRNAEAQKIIADLTGGAEIKRFGPDGKPLADAPAAKPGDAPAAKP